MTENSCCSVQFNFCGTGSEYVHKFQVSVAFIYIMLSIQCSMNAGKHVTLLNEIWSP